MKTPGWRGKEINAQARGCRDQAAGHFHRLTFTKTKVSRCQEEINHKKRGPLAITEYLWSTGSAAEHSKNIFVCYFNNSFTVQIK